NKDNPQLLPTTNSKDLDYHMPFHILIEKQQLVAPHRDTFNHARDSETQSIMHESMSLKQRVREQLDAENMKESCGRSIRERRSHPDVDSGKWCRSSFGMLRRLKNPRVRSANGDHRRY
ncbi:MAG: hypothetical protein LQ348_007099, partial [Seirophora lacunosa]